MTRQVDASEWPLVVMKPSQFGCEGSFIALREALGAILDRGERFCMIADLAHKTNVELPEVRHLSELFRSQGERLDTCLAALALVAPSAMVRGAIKLIFRDRRPKYPYVMLRCRREAKRSLEVHLVGLSTRASMPTAVGH